MIPWLKWITGQSAKEAKHDQECMIAAIDTARDISVEKSIGASEKAIIANSRNVSASSAVMSELLQRMEMTRHAPKK